MPPLLKGTAFVTGAASGIGQATAYALARLGVKRIAITDINAQALKTTWGVLEERHSNLEIKAITMDCGDEKSIEDGVAETAASFGRIDIAVNNAGVSGPIRPSTEVSLAEWLKVVSVNLNGVWLCQRAQIKQMLKQESLGHRMGRGTIVNVASMYGLIASAPTIPATAYTAAKHGVVGLTKSDGVMFASQGIRINAICPGYVATPLLRDSTESGVMKKEVEETPMKRLGDMEEIADSIAFLASPMSSFMAGASLVVDGGFTAK